MRFGTRGSGYPQEKRNPVESRAKLGKTLRVLKMLNWKFQRESRKYRV